MNTKKDFKKDGKEITAKYKEMIKSGITPEDGILFLLAHMQKTKSSSIGMDITGEDGHTFCLTININDGSMDEQEEPVKEEKVVSSSPPGVC